MLRLLHAPTLNQRERHPDAARWNTQVPELPELPEVPEVQALPALQATVPYPP